MFGFFRRNEPVVRINGKDYPGNTLTIKNGVAKIDGKVIDLDGDGSASIKGMLEVHILSGEPVNVVSDGAVKCGDVRGNVTAGGSVNCGAVGGDVKAGSSVNAIGPIKGDIKAGSSVNIRS